MPSMEREELFACYVESGADPDGRDSEHLAPGRALDAVKELRRDYDDACDEVAALHRKLAKAHRILDDRVG